MWLKLNKDELPKGEVVAVNFERNTKEVGEVVFNCDWNIVLCNDLPVTHYLPLPKDEERE